jgi:CHAT domain-containing protein
LALGLGACDKPPPNAYVSTSGAQEATALEIGANAANEACSLQRGATDAQIYCGTYKQPAGHIIAERQVSDPAAFVTASSWRTAFDLRFQCGLPFTTTLLDTQAIGLACSRRQGGWPQVVVAARIGDTLYVADAVKPAEPVIGQAIGVISGRAKAVPVAATPEASALATQRAAEQAINLKGVAVMAEVDRQIARGAKENRQDNFAAAEAAYRAAVTLQERANGPRNPALAVPLARLALQVSNQNRFNESSRLFARAEPLAESPDQIDPDARPTVRYLAALDQLNRNHPAEALDLLNQAERDFTAIVPLDSLVPRRTTGRSGVDRLADNMADASLLQNQTETDALNGLIETHRYRAIALAQLGRRQEAAAALTAARGLYEGRDQRLAARYYRTFGMTIAPNATEAASDLSVAATNFATVQPRSLPLARTQLLQASKLAASGDYTAVKQLCRAAALTLRTLKVGAVNEQVVPCLHALSLDLGTLPATQQPVLAEMFDLSQLAQSSITSRQIALATARLALGARDPRVGEAIRLRDTTTDRLDELYRRQADLAADKDANAAALDSLDADIRKTRDQLAEASQALQAAAPGFAGLVQDTVSAHDAQLLLGPHEALVSVVMDANEGWIFLLRRDHIAIGRLDGGAKRIDALVSRFRTSVEPGPDGQPPPFDVAAAQQIYTAVLGPVADGLDDVDSINVAPSGSLLSIPFGALLTGPASDDAIAKAPFLIRRMAISHVPSVASFVNLRQSAKTAQAPRPWFGLGDFRPPTLQQAEASFPPQDCGSSARDLASLSRLPGAIRELQVARRLLGATASDDMLGSAFTARSVTKASLKDYRVLHFATHAVLPGELRCLDEAALITSTRPAAADASGALLTASEIAQMDLNAELVILAACNSGGPASAGAAESLSGLARSFFFAGARSLVITHWDANDAFTPYLTALFLDGLQANPAAGPAMALAVAQRRVLDEAVGKDAAQGHPYYWAVIALIGGRGALQSSNPQTLAQNVADTAR